MPDQIAHLLFARRVLAAAKPELRARVSADSPAFHVGTFGPDPLFNDPSARRRAEGFEMHRRPGREAMERMRGPVRGGMPWAADYAAGFFCHYALDRLCHPELKALAARGEAKHVAVETAYDRKLYLQGGVDLPRRIEMSASALRAAAAMYTRVTPGRFRSDLNAYWRIRRFLLRGGGTGLARIAGSVKPAWDGLIPYAEPSEGIARGMEILEARIEASVDVAARQLENCFDAFDAGAPLDPWLNADFAGGKQEGDSHGANESAPV